MTLIKTSILTAIATIVKILAGFLINKIVAMEAGASGLAMIGQLQNFITLSSGLSNGSINNGIVKYTSENINDIEYKKKLFSTALKISILISFLCMLVLSIFNDEITLYLFDSLENKNIISLFSITIVFYSLNILLISILNAQGEIKKYVLSNIANSIFMIVLVFFLTKTIGFKGSLYALVISQTLVFIITSLFVIKSSWFKKSYFKHKFDIAIANDLFKFSIMSLVSLIVSLGSTLYIRNYIGENLSWNDAGYWQAIKFISDGYLMIITMSLNIYYLPKLASITNKLLLKKEIAYGYKIVLPISIVLAIIIYVLKEYIIIILFTEEFNPVIELFKWQLFGDILKIGSWMLSIILIAKAQVKYFIVGEILFSFLFVILSIFLIDIYSLVGITYAFVINYTLYWLYMYIVYKKYLRSCNETIS